MLALKKSIDTLSISALSQFNQLKDKTLLSRNDVIVLAALAHKHSKSIDLPPFNLLTHTSAHLLLATYARLNNRPAFSAVAATLSDVHPAIQLVSDANAGLPLNSLNPAIDHYNSICKLRFAPLHGKKHALNALMGVYAQKGDKENLLLCFKQIGHLADAITFKHLIHYYSTCNLQKSLILLKKATKKWGVMTRLYNYPILALLKAKDYSKCQELINIVESSSAKMNKTISDARFECAIDVQGLKIATEKAIADGFQVPIFVDEKLKQFGSI